MSAETKKYPYPFPIIPWTARWLGISVLIVLAGLLKMGLNVSQKGQPLDFGIDFTGGASYVYHFDKLPGDGAANTIRAALANARERGLDAPLLHTKRVAVPLDGERLAEHFGRSQRVAIIEVEPLMRVLGGRGDHEVPTEPGTLPRWLAEQRVDLAIAAGIGAGAEAELARLGIELICGAPLQSPEDLVGAWMDGLLLVGANRCDAH